jgi:hypothetical protein
MYDQVIEPEAIRSARYFSPQDLAQLCLSMARLSYDSEQLLGEIAASARRQLHKFTPRELTILLGAMAKVTDTAIFTRAVDYDHLASIRQLHAQLVLMQQCHVKHGNR